MSPKNPALAADIVVFDRLGRLLLIRRKHPPFKDRHALPGGFVEYGETAEAAALRELHEETGLTAKSPRLIGVYSDPKRDPRGHVVSIAYLVIVGKVNPKGGDDAKSAEFLDNWRGKKLAFDHNRIVADALRLIERS
ncbi:MAG: NUDIX hydrolase [Alphaproteobacteria bacterium]|nr:NUDIX hydrolase [Alphaproteobacteria bacterium]